VRAGSATLERANRYVELRDEDEAVPALVDDAVLVDQEGRRRLGDGDAARDRAVFVGNCDRRSEVPVVGPVEDVVRPNRPALATSVAPMTIVCRPKRVCWVSMLRRNVLCESEWSPFPEVCARKFRNEGNKT
jgi:hypothetical protein